MFVLAVQDQQTFPMKFALLAIALFGLSPLLTLENQWELKKDKDGIRVFTKKIQGSPMRAFRGEMELTANLDIIESLFKDVVRFTEWSPGAKKVEPLKEEVNSRTFYLQTEAPWPVTDRDGIYQFTFQREAGKLTINATCLPEYLPPRKKHVRVPKSEGFWQFEEKADGLIHIIYENHSEPGGSIPGWLANSAVVNLPFESLQNLRQMVQK